MPHWFPKQSASHAGLLDSSHQPPGRARFSAILVPTNRPVESLRDCINLARKTDIVLLVVCSKRVDKDQVIHAARAAGVGAFAVDLPADHANLLDGMSFGTSAGKDILAATSGLTRDLSMKRNLGLVIAQVLGWERLMFLDDDIYGLSDKHVDDLAVGLDDHNVSVLIPEEFPDNSVACHAHRLGGGEQGKFASGGGMGVRCDRKDLPFFPNIYNEDWFFFAEEAADRKIARVGVSQQRKYDPYEDPERAVKEEFGDLLAEGLYARLDAGQGISGVDVAYWEEFIKSRRDFLAGVAESLTRKLDSPLDPAKIREISAAQVSIREAQRQLGQIDAKLCQKFVDLWQTDLVEWRGYLDKLPHFESVPKALNHLGLDYAASSPNTR
jgi:hypothetical protein